MTEILFAVNPSVFSLSMLGGLSSAAEMLNKNKPNSKTINVPYAVLQYYRSYKKGKVYFAFK